ncbi:NeuD/PglB/VioB family sugar acetyltransferase [Fulvivirga sp. 29W222]|uniref:NeuD/PglB/VioB family sugar acetyltransferase n=1 Tax=Fulvivirga marina TaxID=2494733 RepID=A0A937FTX4_9BACT|nr:NeuD/PglB/VioB family sugar acetyltransferase [Fulvivirga marina]MBL6444757.1 NeuD/PglB/VioB family sugar acetyltransferase [Fulvivirga marina]
MVIAGAGGHALETLDILIASGYDPDDIRLYNDFGSTQGLFHNRFLIIKSFNELTHYFLTNDNQFCLGVGSPTLRRVLYNKLIDAGGVLTGIKSGKSVISPYFLWEGDCDIFVNSFISSLVTIGRGTLINSGVKIHHESSIGKFCELAPGATVLGNVSIGDDTTVGANATILPGVRIGKKVTVGAGAVVTKDVSDHCIVVGVPAKIIGMNDK